MTSTVLCRDCRALAIVSDAPTRQRLVEQLERRGIDCQAVGTSKDLYGCLERQFAADRQFDVLLIDVRFEGDDAAAVLARHGLISSVVPTVLVAPPIVEELILAIRGLRTFAHQVLTTTASDADVDTVLAATVSLLGTATGAIRQDGIIGRRSVGFPTDESIVAEGDHSSCDLSALGPVQRNERRLIVEALERTGGHVCDAAKLLRLGQATVYRKIQRYKISRQTGQPNERVPQCQPSTLGRYRHSV